MCLAVPGKIEELLSDGYAVADFMGIKKTVALDLAEDLRVGDYVIVHAGFVLNRLDEDEALESLRYIRELMETQDHEP